MFVKFDPTLGGGTDQNKSYNFMRLITEVATAAAGSTPVVNPLTSAGTYDTNVNLITEVISNTEAGGWTASTTTDLGALSTTAQCHFLDDAGYTDTNLQNRVYRADLYRASGKATYPYVKFTVLPQVQSTWTTYPYIDIVYGCHTDTRWNYVAGYAPNGGSGGGTATTGRNITAPGSTADQLIYHGIRPSETATNQGTASVSRKEWFLAITADYFILIQPFTSITYLGTRTMNAWEQSYSDNPPLVAFHTPVQNWANLTLCKMNAPRKMMAWWRLKDGTGTVRTNPYLSFYQDLARTTEGSTPLGLQPTPAYNLNTANQLGWQRNHVTTNFQNVEYSSSEASSITRISGDPFGGPLFRMKAHRDNYSRYIGNNANNPVYGPTSTTTRPQCNFNFIMMHGPTSINYPPVIDPSTGTLVPPAYPINMMLAITSTNVNNAYYTQGGRCRGIWKSLSGSDQFMLNYYNPGQNFTVDDEDYYPVVVGSDTSYRDMFLIRKA